MRRGARPPRAGAEGMRSRLRSSRPARFSPDPATSQQLIPLFELLSVRDICALACCSSGWSAALDAWRSTEVDIGGALETDYMDDYVTVQKVRTVARKYTQLRSLLINSCVKLDAATLNLLARCTMLRSIECGPVNGPGLVTLARAARQLRVVNVLGYGLDGPSLIALAKACPNLEELTCFSPRVLDTPDSFPLNLGVSNLEYFNDKGALALARSCKSLRRLGILGSGYAFSDAAFVHLVKSCKHLVKLDLVGNILPTAIKRQLRRIAEDRNRPEFRIAEDRVMRIEVACPQEGYSRLLTTRSSDPLGRLMDAYCQIEDAHMDDVRFVFDGEPLDPESTPEDLEMDDRDVVEVFYEYEQDDDDDDETE